ncbi:MAG: hypothetical protein VKS61_13495, partial [Candidatus Sericytochromatia bacterium]|nr:hypothetical protein [Candidatus Sericytochromatia bacterium]
MNLKLADVPLRNVIAHFTAAGVEAGYLVPTLTGLEKSILDAHGPLRDYLRRKGIHDYALQAKGQEAKKEVPAFIVLKDRLVESRATLYRPESKDGDPRIWFKHLPAHVTARNVLAVLAHEGQLYVVNASDAALLATGTDASTPLGRILSRERPADNPAAQELLAKVRTVASRGFIRTMRPGPTGIGY